MSHWAISLNLHVQNKVRFFFMSIALWICSVKVRHAHWQSSLCLYLKLMLSTSELTARKREALYLHISTESYIVFFFCVLIYFLLPHTDLVSGFPSSKPSRPQVTTVFSKYVLPWWNRALLGPRSLIFWGTVQVSCDEVSELNLDHPLSSSFLQETGPHVCPADLQTSRKNSFPQNSVHQLCEKSRDKSQWGANFHLQCQRCEMCQYLLRVTAKTHNLLHNFGGFF